MAGPDIAIYNSAVILLPIGRDDAEIQRHAYTSYFIIALNIAMFILSGILARQSVERRVEAQVRQAVRYYLDHPYLRIPTSLQMYLPERLLSRLPPYPAHFRPPADEVRRQQKTLDDLAEIAAEMVGELPYFRWGYIPADGGLIPLFTSMFIHGGFFHLLGNLMFFFVTGPFLEDVFGRPVFGFLYFSGGIVATLTFAMRHPDSGVPLIGASGAIAAVMGAYLVRFARSKLEFLFVPFIWRPMTFFRFFVPAFVVLPLWFLQQWWMMAREASSGVAFSAHVGGFVYGVIVGAVVRASGFEDRYVKPVVEKETTWKADPRLEAAMAARSVGNLEAARANVSAVLAADANNVEALQVAVDVGRDLNDASMFDGCAARLLQWHMQQKNTDEATNLIHEVTHDREAPPAPRFYARAAAFAERSGDREWAANLYEHLARLEADTPNVVGTLVKLGTTLRLKGDMKGARDAYTRARSHPACNAELAATIEMKLAQLK